MEIGEKIRTLRIKKNMSIQELADKVSLSKGMISQLERDLTCPSVSSLWNISKALGVNMNYFFENSNENNQIVRKDQRKKITTKNRTCELLCPDLKRQIEMLWVEIPPGESFSTELISHEGEECGVVIEGTLKVVSGNEICNLNLGDSIYLDSTIPHKYINEGKVKSVSIWSMVPPSF